MNTDTLTAAKTADAPSIPQPKSRSFNEQISHTADGVAYRRTFTEIPHSLEIFEISQELGAVLTPAAKSKADGTHGMTPMFEARYIITDDELARSGIAQIMELASGLSPRGYIACCENPDVKFIEIDLVKKMYLKRKVIVELHDRHGTAINPNHKLLDGNVAENGVVGNTARAFFDATKPVFIICEGLLRYMDWPDKKKIGTEIRDVLRTHGGMWVTPDIELLSDANATQERRDHYQKMAETFGFDVRPFLFNDMDHALSFFGDMGFKVKLRPHISVIDRLVCPKRLNLSDTVVRDTLRRRTSFVLKV